MLRVVHNFVCFSTTFAEEKGSDKEKKGFGLSLNGGEKNSVFRMSSPVSPPPLSAYPCREAQTDRKERETVRRHRGVIAHRHPTIHGRCALPHSAPLLALPTTEGWLKQVHICVGTWIRVNDPSAGSPTETLLRLLLPLNGQVCSSSRMNRRSCQLKFNSP